MSELGIKSPLVYLQVYVTSLPFISMIPTQTKFLVFIYTFLFTGEPMHTASKERMVPELMFLSERTPQVSITNSKVK